VKNIALVPFDGSASAEQVRASARCRYNIAKVIKAHLHQERSGVMMLQHNDVPARVDTADRTPQLTAWLADWPAVRREVEALLEEYERQNLNYDPHWTECVFEMTDSALANLAHRATWLQTRLERPEETFHGVLDPEYFALLAAQQVG
jgi:hypothetical protein